MGKSDTPSRAGVIFVTIWNLLELEFEFLRAQEGEDVHSAKI
jgi:hypothetical protein